MAPIDFRLDTTHGKTISLSDLRGKPAIVFIETTRTSSQNESLKARLRREADRPGMDQLVSVVPVALMVDAASPVQRAVAKAAITGYARSVGLELWLDWSGESLQALGGGDPGYSTVAVLSASGSPVWVWRGGAPVEECIAYLRREIEAAFPGALASIV